MTGPGRVSERVPLTRRLLWALAVGAGTAAVICLLVILATLVRQRPVPVPAVLLILAVPLLIAGQLWTIAFAMARKRDWRSGTGGWRSHVDPRQVFFGDLRRDTATGLLLLMALAAGLATATAFTALDPGTPGSGDSTCPYPLTQHGVHTCVSKEEYEHARAAQQRAVAAALFAGFSLHTFAALGGVLGGRGPGRSG